MFGGDTLIYSDGESSVGETESILPVYDGRLGGYSNDETAPANHEPIHRTIVYMAGTTSGLKSMAVGAMMGTSTSAPAPNLAGSVKPPAQVLSESVVLLVSFIGISSERRG